VSLNHDHDDVYSIHHYVIKFISDLRLLESGVKHNKPKPTFLFITYYKVDTSNIVQSKSILLIAHDSLIQ
jgi:hypothetical protein